jgi:hypothetical protein
MQRDLDVWQVYLRQMMKISVSFEPPNQQIASTISQPAKKHNVQATQNGLHINQHTQKTRSLLKQTLPDAR